MIRRMVLFIAHVLRGGDHRMFWMHWVVKGK